MGTAAFYEATVDGSPGIVVFGPDRRGTWLRFEDDGMAHRVPAERVTDLVPAWIDHARPCQSTAVLPRGGGLCVKTVGAGGRHKGPHRDNDGREWT